MAQPLDGAAPAAIVHLNHDQHVAAAVPCKAASIEDELVPTNHFLEVTFVDKVHCRTKWRRSVHSDITHVGHPNADVLDVVAISAVAEPTDTRHRSSGSTGLGQLGSRVELLAE